MLSRAVALTAAATYRLENLSVDQLDESFSGDIISLDFGIQAFLF